MKDLEKPDYEESIPNMIDGAVQMFKERSDQEVELINYIATMTDHERVALCLAYRIYKDEKEKLKKTSYR